MKTSSLVTVGIVVIFLFGNLLEAGFSRPESLELVKPKKHNCGGVGRGGRGGYSNSPEIDALARFAVQEHNKKENALLEYVRVLKAKEQVVAGKLYHLTVEAVDAGVKKAYEVKVWVKPWMNFKQLQEFKPIDSSFTSVELGLKRD